MEKENKQKEIMREWWAANRAVMCEEAKITLVYEKFKEYHIGVVGDLRIKNRPVEPIKEYIFRTFIRKNGYNNGKNKKLQKAIDRLFEIIERP